MCIRDRVKDRTSGLVLAGRTGEGIHPDSLTTAMARLRRGKLKALGQRKAFSVHDLRRSAATAWGEHLGAAPHVIDAALGHAHGDRVTQAYQHQRYSLEQADLMRRWGELVADHVARDPGDNVLPLRHRA